MKRRNFLYAFGSGISFGVAGCTQKTKKLDGTIKTSIFIGDHFAEKHERTNPKETLQIAKEEIEYAMKPVIGETDIELDIKTESKFIPFTDYVSDPRNDTMSFKTVREAINKHTDSLSQDSNVALTSVSLPANGLGIVGEPCQTGETGSIGIAQAPKAFFGVDEGVKSVKQELSSSLFLHNLVHEFGHTIGMEHRHGTVVDVKEDEIFVTPMLSRYINSDKFTETENRFGEYIPSRENRIIKFMPQFNSSIEPEDINLVDYC